MKEWIKISAIFIVAYIAGAITIGIYCEDSFKETSGLTGLIGKDTQLVHTEMMLELSDLLIDKKYDLAKERAHGFSEVLIEGVQLNIIGGEILFEENTKHPKLYNKVQDKAEELVARFNRQKHITSTTTKAPLRGAGPP